MVDFVKGGSSLKRYVSMGESWSFWIFGRNNVSGIQIVYARNLIRRLKQNPLWM